MSHIDSTVKNENLIKSKIKISVRYAYANNTILYLICKLFNRGSVPI
ncbi:hypothetical protein H1P_950006 [Hyella patelloides LEGE 07179]|uniref:Uncharacterized protein n=1 Tax=Hyella patelloides LEGE 07179 TaxID=945734 RepID=A0A563W5H8_9CYAN|nr:hypothetical protein H1P_950006 [Hyella patelloides LEGE 07179]